MSGGRLDVDSVFSDVATTIVSLEPVNSNTAVGDFRSDAGRSLGLVASHSRDIKALRLWRLSAFVASDEAEGISDSIYRAVEGEFEVVSKNGLIFNITIFGVSVSELIMAHVITIWDVFTTGSVLPLDSDFVVTALLVVIQFTGWAKFNWADGFNRRCANLSRVDIGPRSISAVE